ncbi:MAG: aldo/keto reductase [Peptococcaceae bacterium]|nr:aldo/keto reductase [Peptococcaceae bacterium]
MIYKQFQDLKLSALGMGAMRLPVLDGDNSKIDEAAVAEMVAYAMEQGINYYDTAYMYHDGQSEIVMGKVLNKYPRENYYIATKFPGYDKTNMEHVAEIFEKQLEKTGMEYFDFYLFHNVNETNIDAYLDPQYGIYEYLMEQKKNGRIRHLGFSTHGDMPVMTRFLEAYGKDMEFCQIQLNYIDYTFQNDIEKLALLKSYNIPVWVMEPLRGGKLANIDDIYFAKLNTLRAAETKPGWAFRFLQSIPEVTMVLSGMSNFTQLKENIETFSTDAPLNEAEWNTVLGIADDMIQKIALPCTSCKYCTEKCPMELNIPALIEIYNEHVFTGGGFLPGMKLSVFPEDKRPNACIGCRSCEAVCPQNIKISEAMRDFAEKMKG